MQNERPQPPSPSLEAMLDQFCWIQKADRVELLPNIETIPGTSYALVVWENNLKVLRMLQALSAFKAQVKDCDLLEAENPQGK
jgi:hypothetical protein